MRSQITRNAISVIITPIERSFSALRRPQDDVRRTAMLCVNPAPKFFFARLLIEKLSGIQNPIRIEGVF